MHRAKFGGSLLAAVLFGLVPAGALAQQEFAAPDTHHTWLGSLPNPSSITVTYYVGPGFSAAQESLIHQAAAAWSEAATGIPLVLAAGGPGSNIVITQTFTNNGPPAQDSTSSSVVTTTIPVGTAPDGHQLRQITSATITLGGNDNGVGQPAWHTDLATLPGANVRDFYSVLLREFGLSLGLGFATTDALSVMTVGLPPNGTVRRSLSDGDLDALQHLYGTPEPATWALFGLGLLGVGWARRTRSRSMNP